MNVTPRGAHITARAIKLTVVLDPMELRAALQPYATVDYRISFGPENVVCLVQGKLLADNSIDEAGLTVQPKRRAE
jgi:hypothetical protein